MSNKVDDGVRTLRPKVCYQEGFDRQTLNTPVEEAKQVSFSINTDIKNMRKSQYWGIFEQSIYIIMFISQKPISTNLQLYPLI